MDIPVSLISDIVSISASLIAIATAISAFFILLRNKLNYIIRFDSNYNLLTKEKELKRIFSKILLKHQRKNKVKIVVNNKFLRRFQKKGKAYSYYHIKKENQNFADLIKKGINSIFSETFLDALVIFPQFSGNIDVLFIAFIKSFHPVKTDTDSLSLDFYTELPNGEQVVAVVELNSKQKHELFQLKNNADPLAMAIPYFLEVNDFHQISDFDFINVLGKFVFKTLFSGYFGNFQELINEKDLACIAYKGNWKVGLH